MTMKTHGPRSQVLRLLLLMGVMVFVLAPTAALAQTGGTDVYPTVPTTPTTQPCCGTVPKSPPPQSSLPFTGGDVALLAVLGVGAVASGGAILAFSKRRSTSAAA
jgi:uncharacterized surface anchored protein